MAFAEGIAAWLLAILVATNILWMIVYINKG